MSPKSQPQSTYDVFISYNSADEEWVQNELLRRLDQAGIRYIHQLGFELGRPRLREVERAIAESRKTLLVLSPSFLTSNWEQFDSILAGEYGLSIGEWRDIPVIVETCELPGRLAALTSVDLREGDEDQWQHLLNELSPGAKSGPGTGKKSLLDDPRYRKITEEIRGLRAGEKLSCGYQGRPDQPDGAQPFDYKDFAMDWQDCKEPDLTKHEKGIRLEKVLGQLVSPVFRVMKEHLKSQTEEFDLVLELLSQDPTWQSYGPWVPVEAKNWAALVGQPEITAFFQKVRLHRLRLALFVSMTGFTKDAVQQARMLNASSDYPTLLLISGAEIEQGIIEDCISPEEFLKDKLLLTVFGG